MEEKEMINKMLKEGKISQEEADKLLGALKKSYGLDDDEKIEDYKDETKTKTEQKKNKDKDYQGNSEEDSQLSKLIRKNVEKTVNNSTGIIDEIKSLFNGFFGTGYEFVKTFRGKFTVDVPLIDLNNTNGMIKVNTWEEDEYKLDLNFSISADDESQADKIKDEIYELSQEEDKLQLEIENKKAHRISVDIFLTLPKGFVYETNIESTNGKIRVEKLQTKGLRVNTKNGKMTLADIKGTDTKVKGTNGKIYYNGISDNVILKTTNGKILADLINSKTNLELKTTNGSLEVNIPHEAEFYVDSKVKLGSIGLALDNVNWVKEKEKVVKKHYIVESNNWEENKGIKVTARTTNGSINVSHS